MKKAQTVFTARLFNKAAHENRKAIRNSKRQERDLRNSLMREHRMNPAQCYVTIDGVAFPTAR